MTSSCSTGSVADCVAKLLAESWLNDLARNALGNMLDKDALNNIILFNGVWISDPAC